MNYPSETGCIYDGKCPDCEIADAFVNRVMLHTESLLEVAGGASLLYMLNVVCPPLNLDVMDNNIQA